MGKRTENETPELAKRIFFQKVKRNISTLLSSFLYLKRFAISCALLPREIF